MKENPRTAEELAETEKPLASASPPPAPSTQPLWLNWNPAISCVLEYSRFDPSRVKHTSVPVGHSKVQDELSPSHSPQRSSWALPPHTPAQSYSLNSQSGNESLQSST